MAQLDSLVSNPDSEPDNEVWIEAHEEQAAKGLFHFYVMVGKSTIVSGSHKSLELALNAAYTAAISYMHGAPTTPRPCKGFKTARRKTDSRVGSANVKGIGA